MNVYEFAEEFKLSLAKTRKIKKRFPQIFDDVDDALDPLRASLANGDPLTGFQLVQLIEQPSGLLELGRYASRAECELAALGNPQAAPMEVAANIREAAKGEAEALAILIEWLKSIIGPHPVGHAFIAVRLLLCYPPNIRKAEGSRIPRALLNTRQHPDFAGWWHSVPGPKNRNVTIYQKSPGFDL